MSEVCIRQPDPHCIVWQKAKASLWGMADDHDLDEPVRLTNELLCRLRYINNSCGEIITDRVLSFKTIRCGHHLALRFYFSSGRYFETEVQGASAIPPGATWADIDATRLLGMSS